MILKFLYSFKFGHWTLENIHFFGSLFYVPYGKTGNLYIFGVNDNHKYVSKILTFLCPLEEKFTFFSLLGFEAKSDLDHKTLKIRSQSTRASEQYVNDKNWINAQEATSIFRLSAENFESDFKYT